VDIFKYNEYKGTHGQMVFWTVGPAWCGWLEFDIFLPGIEAQTWCWSFNQKRWKKYWHL